MLLFYTHPAPCITHQLSSKQAVTKGGCLGTREVHGLTNFPYKKACGQIEALDRVCAPRVGSRNGSTRLHADKLRHSSLSEHICCDTYTSISMCPAYSIIHIARGIRVRLISDLRTS